MRFCLYALLLVPFICNAQSSSLQYDIFFKTSKIGDMQINAFKDGNKSTITMKSYVEVSFIISQTFKILEKALFENDKLMYSEARRIKSGTITLDNQTKAIDNYYHLKNKEGSKILKTNAISYNFLMLYLKEPKNITSVYSDNFQKFLSITKLKDHHFKVVLPNNDYNEYFYINGLCSMVKIHTGFFNVEMRQQNIFIKD
ncbi:hypothetical protein A5893_14605 [Pedobacter psychrophilus]|uniref:DUF3108 domain-containing protein n=1 Tax=Pedobacter psychrophilus TaxID=1826909 RepID=A0A179DC56_9SPHI|nr:DUF6134 family protein [Pedobacter psychrophilus]OAQ38635.1 hypothetical protein A5893_14605 [Pedobacter psychrophilus]